VKHRAITANHRRQVHMMGKHGAGNPSRLAGQCGGLFIEHGGDPPAVECRTERVQGGNRTGLVWIGEDSDVHDRGLHSRNPRLASNGITDFPRTGGG